MSRGPQAGSLPTRLREYFDTHAGMFRCQDIARELGYDRTWAVANECGRMYRDGKIARTKIDVPGRAKPVTYYHALIHSKPPAAARKETANP